jgi:hypothetical protein
MKVRNGFVANSSSSSFVIRNIAELTPKQKKAIFYPESFSSNPVMKSEFRFKTSDKWDITLYKAADCILCHTYMTNFDFRSFLKSFGITICDGKKNLSREDIKNI